MAAYSPRDERPRLVGREREQRFLRICLGNARAGKGSLALISGDAGIGKTALVVDLAHEASSQMASVHFGHCYDTLAKPAYGPWVDIGLFDETFVEDRESSQPSADIDQVTFFERASEWLKTRAEQQPRVLILEDFHWADVDSLELLRHLCHQIVSLPVLLVVTYRSELTSRDPLYRRLPALSREAPVRRLSLRRLSKSAIGELVVNRYGLREHDANRLRDYLERVAEGNPFFINEILRSLEENQRLQWSSVRWTLGPLRHTQVPPLLRQVIDERMARIDDAARQLLVVAAVIGREVPLDLWSEVSQSTDEELTSAVTQALSVQVLEETEDGEQLRFRHALIREALLKKLVLPLRRTWHRKIAETLASRPQPDPDVIASHFQRANDSRAAEWLIEAGERAQRTAWLTAAEHFESALAIMQASGENAAKRGWMLARIAQLRRFSDQQRSVELLNEAERLALAAGDQLLQGCALFYRGDKYFMLGDVRRGLTEQRSGVEILEQLSPTDQDRFHTLVHDEGWPDEGSPRSMLVGRLANLGRFSEARALATRVLNEFSEPDANDEDPARIARIGPALFSGLAESLANAGEPDQALAAFGRARAGFEITHNRTLIGSAALRELFWVLLPYFADDPTLRQHILEAGEAAWGQTINYQGVGWTARMAYLPALVLEGEWDEAYTLASQSHGTHRTVFRHGVTSVILGQVSWYRGEPERAWNAIQDVLTDGPATEPGDVNYFVALILQRLAIQLALDASDLECAETWLDAHERWLDWSDAHLGRAEARLLSARRHHTAKDISRALHDVDEAIQLAGQPRQPIVLLKAHRLKSELLIERGRIAEATDEIDESLKLAQDCSAPFQRALSLLVQTRLHIASRRAQEARDTLIEADTICTQLRARPTLGRITHLWDGVAQTSSTSASGVLSDREQGVLRLVAQGLTDREVAAELFISPRTVGAHLRSIYNKLDVPSRAGAVREALQRDLI